MNCSLSGNKNFTLHFHIRTSTTNETVNNKKIGRNSKYVTQIGVLNLQNDMEKSKNRPFNFEEVEVQ